VIAVRKSVFSDRIFFFESARIFRRPGSYIVRTDYCAVFAEFKNVFLALNLPFSNDGDAWLLRAG
jgi:hypothetical protein